MCMLSFIPGGTPIEEQDLLNGGIQNGDGSGWAIATENKILMGKSMKVEEALDEFVKMRDKHPESPALFHSRWATHGNVNVGNVHPFLVGGSHKTVMAHNGILPCKPEKNDWRSDTRILADEYLNSRYRRLDKPTVRKALQDYIGKGNKLVILTVDKQRYKENAYIINEESGHWDEVTGIWHSNYDYVGRSAYGSWENNYGLGWKGSNGTKKFPGYVKTKNGYWVPESNVRSTSDVIDDYKQCYYCGYGEIGKAGYCMDCGTCETCYEFRKECNCYSSYYRAMDWDQETISRKALEAKNALDCPRDENGIPTIGYRKDADEAQNSEDYARGGMQLDDIMDQIDEALAEREE